MKFSTLFFICLIVSSFLIGATNGDLSERVFVNGGEFIPMYSYDNVSRSVLVKQFKIDPKPVTNHDFFKFVKANPGWLEKVRASKLLNDGNLLKHWTDCPNLSCPKKTHLNKPVINISWFAAEEYCRWKKGRLPSVLEWEYVAAADEDRPNAANDPVFYERLLKWYSKPNPNADSLSDVAQGKANFWGIYDLHGLVWEWTSDFNSVFVSGDNRGEGDNVKNLFCGAGAASAGDKANYAAFMRYAMRNSLKGSYTTSNLGFRCAYD